LEGRTSGFGNGPISIVGFGVKKKEKGKKQPHRLKTKVNF